MPVRPPQSASECGPLSATKPDGGVGTSRLPDPPHRRLLADAAWSSAFIPVQVGLGVLQLSLLSRLLGPNGVGTIGLCVAACATYAGVFRANSSDTLLTFATRALSVADGCTARRVVRFAYSLDFLSSFVAFALLGATAILLPSALGVSSDALGPFVLYATSIVTSSVENSSLAVLRLGGRFHWVFLQRVCHSVLKTTVVAALYSCDTRLEGTMFALTATIAVDNLSLFLLARFTLRRLDFDGRSQRPPPPLPRRLWHFSALTHGRGMVKSLTRNIDTLLLGHYATPAAVGLFRAAKQLTEVLTIPAQALVSAIYPAYSRLWHTNAIPRLRRVVSSLSLVLFVIGIGAASLVALTADSLIGSVLGDQFLAARDSVMILLICAVVQLVMSAVYPLPSAAGHAGPPFRATVAALALQAVVLVLALPKNGAMAAAWSNVAFVCTWAILVIAFVLRLLRKTPATSNAAVS
jgi:O-antigen/teichoic acid export membrane protein